VVEPGASFDVLHALLDPEEPFEWDPRNTPHAAAHVLLGPDDALDAYLLGEPEFFDDDGEGDATWLMVGEIPGTGLIVVPLVESEYSGYSKVRPLGVFEAPLHIIERYYQEKGRSNG
jgi:hypothetical protein